MKIIKDNLNGSWPKRFVCKSCGSELFVSPEDIENRCHDKDTNLYFFECPVCEFKFNQVDVNRVPLKYR